MHHNICGKLKIVLLLWKFLVTIRGLKLSVVCILTKLLNDQGHFCVSVDPKNYQAYVARRLSNL